MQQIYQRTPMVKCDFNKISYLIIEITLRHGCSLGNLLHIFRTPFTRNTSGWLLLYNSTFQIALQPAKLGAVWNKQSFKNVISHVKEVFIKFFETLENCAKKKLCSQLSFVLKLPSQPTITSSKLTTECQWRRSGVFIVNYEHISHIVLVFLLLTLSR